MTQELDPRKEFQQQPFSLCVLKQYLRKATWIFATVGLPAVVVNCEVTGWGPNCTRLTPLVEPEIDGAPGDPPVTEPLESDTPSSSTSVSSTTVPTD